jgi:hypothetical protein
MHDQDHLPVATMTVNESTSWTIETLRDKGRSTVMAVGKKAVGKNMQFRVTDSWYHKAVGFTDSQYHKAHCCCHNAVVPVTPSH